MSGQEEEYELSIEIGSKTVALTLEQTITLNDLSEFLIAEQLIPPNVRVAYYGYSSKKLIENPTQPLSTFIHHQNDIMKVLVGDEIEKFKNLITFFFLIIKSGVTIQLLFDVKNLGQMEELCNYLRTQNYIEPHSKIIVFVNNRNNKEARNQDKVSALQIQDKDEILVYEDEQYQKSQIAKERANYQIINQDKQLIDIVQCMQMNHAPNKIQFICQQSSCDQLPACCSFCLKGIHNNHKNLDDFIQLNEIKNLDFSIYQKFVLQVKEMRTIIQEQIEGLNKLIELFNPKEKLVNYMQQPGYENANKLGYAIKFLNNIPNISKSVDRMRMDFQYKIDILYRKLMIGLKFDDIVKNIQPDSHIEYQFQKSKFLKQRKLVVDLKQSNLKIDQIHIEIPQTAPVAMIRNIVIDKIIKSNNSFNPDDMIKQPALFFEQKKRKFGLNWEKVCQIIEDDNDVIQVYWGQERIEQFIKEH